MFKRPTTNYKLSEVRDQLHDGGNTITAEEDDIELLLTDVDPCIRVKDVEVPVTERGLTALANRYGVPSKFLLRIDPDMQQDILNKLMIRKPLISDVLLGEDVGIMRVKDPKVELVDLREIIDIAERVISSDAPVIQWWEEPSEFRMDVVVPEGFDRGFGGDQQVNDLTGAGLRFTQNLKQSSQLHAPSVSLLLYRLACTNGYENVDASARLDARGRDLETVMENYEALAQREFRRAEGLINHFYELRNNRIKEPEQYINRISSEHDLPARLTLKLQNRLNEMEDKSKISEFDLVNIITNEANNPEIGQEGTRRKLEQVGGVVISQQAERCTQCHSRIS